MCVVLKPQETMRDVIRTTGPDEGPLDSIKSQGSRMVGHVPNSGAAKEKVAQAVDHYQCPELGGEMWRKLPARGCYFGVLMAVLYTIWTLFNPTTGYHAFRMMWSPVMTDHSRPQSSGTCNTPECVHAASEILFNLSPRRKIIDPCNNIEELVCGGWRDLHDYRPDQGAIFTGTLMAERSQMKMRHILEAGYPKGSEHSAFSPARISSVEKSIDEQNFNKMKVAYNACMDVDLLQRLGAEPLKRVLDQIASIFPVQAWAFANVAQSSYTRDTILHLSRFGATALVSPSAETDSRDPDAVVVTIAAPYSVGLPAHEHYLDKALVEKYGKTISDVFSALFPQNGYDDANGIIELETKLAAISPRSEDRGNITLIYNPMSLDRATARCPEIDLQGMVNALARPTRTKVERVIVNQPEYLESLSQILRETHQSTLQKFFIWRVIQSLGDYIESDALLPWLRFRNEIQGKEPNARPERWRTCISHVDSGLGWILSRFFIEAAFSQKAKELGDRIVSEIKTSFIEKLKATEWMDKKVINLAIEKVHNIRQKIGYPTSEALNITDPGFLANYYKNVQVNGSGFFENVLSMRELNFDNEWDALGKPVDREQWHMTMPTVNAYYNPPGNEIVFPAGIMQPPLFDPNLPHYLTYGAFGSIAGHELSHAFDSMGRLYDANGNYTDWWTPSTVRAFESRAQCFVEQYSGFNVSAPDGSQVPVNGRLTLGENIADAGGSAAAFAARAARNQPGWEADLPGLEDYSHDQLFFVSYATFFCGKISSEAAVNRVYTDPHAPDFARVLGTMANSKGFREAYKCPLKKPTCEIW